MKRTSTISLLFFGAIVYFLFAANSNGRATQTNTGNTGAPGESATCSNCHSGGAYGPVNVSIQAFIQGTSTPVTSYTPGATYDMRVTVQAGMGSPNGYGFQMTCLTLGNNTPLAGYSNLASNVKQKAVTIGTYAGRTYVEQNGVTNNNQFNMSWTAPAAGTGTVRFYAAGNCVNLSNNTSGDLASTTNFTLTEAASLAATGSVSHPLCAGESNGAIDVQITSGTAPFSFEWENNVMTEDRTNIPAGNYSVIISDATGQITNINFTVTDPELLTLTATPSDASCFGIEDGQVDFAFDGGTAGQGPSYIVQLIGPSETSQSSFTGSYTFQSLPAGAYTISVNDVNGCEISTEFTISEPTAFSVAATAEPISCISAEGTIFYEATGGTMPYQDFIATQTVDTPGTYSYSFNDANGCNASGTVEVEALDAFEIESTLMQPSCNGDCNGMISLSTINATSEVSFTWNDELSGTMQENLCAGTYIILGVDENGCSITQTIELMQPEMITPNVSFDPINCNGETTELFITASGGTGELLINLDGEPFSSGMYAAGNYIVDIVDANGCMMNFTQDITQPDALEISIVSNGLDTDGTIELSGIGGTAPYEYVWTTGSENALVTLPFNEPHQVTITDANGCSIVSESFTSTVSNIFELGGYDVSIYPNPASNELTFAVEGISLSTVSWSMMDALGRTAQRGIIGLSGKIDISALPEGMYYLQINFENSALTKKILIQR